MMAAGLPHNCCIGRGECLGLGDCEKIAARESLFWGDDPIAICHHPEKSCEFKRQWFGPQYYCGCPKHKEKAGKSGK